MSYSLYDRKTQTVVSWPRDDDEPVVGLDRDHYHVLIQIHLDQPHPGPGEQILPAAPIVEIHDPDADVNGTVTYGWEVMLPPPPPPSPDWPQFRGAIRSENGFYDAYRTALNADPMVVPLLGSRLDDFERDGNFEPFLESLTVTLQSLPPEHAAHIAQEFLALASRCGLPASFLEALQTLFPEPA